MNESKTGGDDRAMNETQIKNLLEDANTYLNGEFRFSDSYELEQKTMFIIKHLLKYAEQAEATGYERALENLELKLKASINPHQPLELWIDDITRLIDHLKQGREKENKLTKEGE